MRINTDSATIERGGVAQEHAFTIAAKGKAFEILSSGLYTDPNLAIVRELCCNARDSQIKNGNPDEPFLVHLPNRLEPWFEVRDYGVGLSEHDVFHIFSTYFESTKDDSDDFIGCLGLGSKSPFSYADAFEVVSWFDGVRSTYSMFKNEVGVPSVAKMAEAPSDEPTGLSVKLTIKSEDHRGFKERLASALKFFETKPRVVGAEGFKFEALPEDTISGDTWILDAKRSGYRSGTLTAVQGGVGYKIDQDQISRQLDSSDVTLLREVSVVLYFDIGQIDVPPSREEVRYDDRTVSNIVASIKRFRLELTTKIEERLAHIPTNSTWKGFALLREYSQQNFDGYRGITSYLQRTAITNPLLKAFARSNGDMRIDLGRPATADRAGNPVEKVGYGGLQHFAIRVYRAPGYGATRLTSHTSQISGAVELRPSKKSVVCLFDEKNRAVLKLSQYTEEGGIRDEIVAIVPNSYKTFATDKAAQKELKWIINQLGHPDVIRVSDIEINTDSALVKKVTATRDTPFYKFERTDRSAAAARRWGGDDMIVWTKTLPDDKKAPTEGLYFLVSAHRHIRRGNTTDTNIVDWSREFNKHIGAMVKLINAVRGTSYTTDQVWGAHVGLIRKDLAANPKWLNIFDLAADCLDPVRETAERRLRVMVTDHFMDFDKGISSPELRAEVRSLDESSVFRQTIEPLFEIGGDITDEQVSLITTAEALVQVLGSGSVEFPTPHNTHAEPIYSTAELFKTYPMLAHVDHFGYKHYAERKQAFEYIRLIDGQKS